MSRASSRASVSGARRSSRAATSSGVGAGRGRRPLEAVDLDRLLRSFPRLLVEVFPVRVAGGGDATRLEREVVRIGRLRERLLEGDEPFAPERHQRLVEGLHAVGGEEIGRATSELQSPVHLVCRLLLEKKNPSLEITITH